MPQTFKKNRAGANSSGRSSADASWRWRWAISWC